MIIFLQFQRWLSFVFFFQFCFTEDQYHLSKQIMASDHTYSHLSYIEPDHTGSLKLIWLIAN